MDFDVVISGAGPAGSSAALAAAALGARVLLLEKRDEIGVPVRCGEFIPSTAELGRILNAPGLDELFDCPEKCIALRTAKLCVVTPAGRRIDVDFGGLSLWRARFDRHLARRAAEAGAEVRTGVNVRSAGPDGVKTDEDTIQCKAVVAADGAFSPIRRAAGIPDPEFYPIIQYAVPGDFGDRPEFYIGNRTPGGHGWVIPKGRMANIGIGGPRWPRRSLSKKLDNFVWDMGIHDRPMIQTEGFLPSSGPIAQTVRENILFAGDAAGQTLPAHLWGVPLALVCGRAAGTVAANFCAGKGSLRDYDKLWQHELGELIVRSLKLQRIFRRISWSDFLTELVLLFSGARGIRRALFKPKKKS